MDASAADQGLLHTVAGWAAAAVGMVGSIALLRRRWSRDGTEITKDRVEGNFVETLLRERDESIEALREATIGRQNDSKIVARLTAENAHLVAEVERLNSDFTRFQRMLSRVYPDTRQFLGLLDSNFLPLPPSQPKAPS